MPRNGFWQKCSNSLRGKWAKRQNRTQTKLISDPHELYRLLATPGVEVVNLIIASESVVWASWRYIAKEMPSLRHTEVTAAYVACVDRMYLYSHLD